MKCKRCGYHNQHGAVGCVVCGYQGDGRGKADETVAPKPCRKCGSRDIEFYECGYSSFNVGKATCRKCGHEVKAEFVSTGPSSKALRDVIHCWNADKPTPEEQLKTEKKKLRALRKQIREMGEEPKA